MWLSNPTPTLTGEWLMTMVNDILKQMPGLGQPQRKFLATLFFTILVLRGRVNYRNLSRYCDYSERTIARQFREPFDWPDFHQRVLMTALDPRSELVSAHDASFIPKSGKQTFGLGHFFNGCASRAERGLEISTLAVVDVTRRCALTLAVSQTPPGEDTTKAEQDETRVDFYKQQLRAHRHRLPPSVTYHCVDGYYAKKKYIDEVVSLGLHAITKLRSDADCMFLYTGPHPKRRGAKRKYDGKVNFQDLSRFEDLGTREAEPHLHLYTAVAWHKTLKRRLRLVVLLNRKDPAKPRFIVLGSTDPELHGHKLIDLYAARFQIEFLFRDSKQFTGLLDCQARAESALDFHFNASLATLNLVRAEALRVQQGQEPQVFSMASWKQCQFNERLLDLFMEKLALDPTWVKNHPCYDELRTYGAIAA
jgi:DDE superfamily endonuclease